MITTPVILAAGKGTRMKSSLPKVLHPLLGKPLVHYAIQAVSALAQEKPVLVVGHKAELIKNALGDRCRYVHQDQLLGTGHAVQQAEGLLRGNSDQVLVTNADMPLIRPGTLQELVEAQEEHSGPITMLTLEVENPRGFGRVIRNEKGAVQAIREEKAASPQELEIKELNSGIYCFSADWLWEALGEVELSQKGEYYLTDLVQIAVEQGETVRAIKSRQPKELIGINTRVHLAEAGSILRDWVNRGLMTAGVSMPDPQTVYVEPGVEIGRDTTLLPGTHLQGMTVIGESCTIGPGTIIRDSRVADGCKIQNSVLEGAVLEEGVDVGPFSHLREGAHLARGVHVGNFGEIKNSYLGQGTKMGHFSYLGDAQLGREVNVGAGTITCNYDGRQKHQTVVGDQVFLGSDTMLVAPVELGKGSRTGAGSVVTRDIGPEKLALGVPAREIKNTE